MKISHLILLTILTANSFGQSWDKYPYGQFGTRKLRPTKFDIEQNNILIYLKRNVNIYFKQSDIKEYILEACERDSTNRIAYKQILDLMNENRKKIEIVDLVFSYSKNEADSVMKAIKLESFNRDLNYTFEFLGADLIIDGKFMIYSLKQTKFIDSGLKAKPTKGIYGNRYYNYFLPDGKSFYSIVTTLGE